jgi:hypothetical protein
LGANNPNNNFVGYWKDPAQDDLPPGMLYQYELQEDEHASGENRTTVFLYFVVSTHAPLDGILVYAYVINHASDTDNEKYRLMQVHCPFVRLPKIGSNAQDDVITIGDYLLKNPISNYIPTVEPYAIVGHEEEEYAIESNFYPTGFQARAYYNTSEFQGRGIYMAVYNTRREVAQNNLYKKHQSDYDNWDWIGHSSNWPNHGFRDYLVWDVVRYTEDINIPENDFPQSLDDMWGLGAFMKFYDTGLDWYEAATLYRTTYEFLNNSNARAGLPINHVVNKMNITDSLWPDIAAKFNSDIPDAAKYQPFFLYMSPQYSVPLLRNSFNDVLTNRLREWQIKLQNVLEVYPGHNTMLFASWIPRWAEDENQIELYRNFPEWAGGWIPFDSNLSDFPGDINYPTKFFRAHIKNRLDEIRTGGPSTVKFISMMHGYLFDGLREHTIINDPLHHLTGEYRTVSWPYNNEASKRPEKIWRHMSGFPGEATNEKNFYWWDNRSYYSNGYDETGGFVPQRKKGNWELNPASRYGMDYMLGGLVTGSDTRLLDFGILDSQLHDSHRTLGADGIYMAAGGSVPFTPVYVGYQNLTGTLIPPAPKVICYRTNNPIPPGGGITQYKAQNDMLDYLQTEYPNRIRVNEGLGDCFLDKYHIVMADSWPGGSFAKTQTVGFCTFASELKVKQIDRSNLLPVTWIPFTRAIAGDRVIFQGSQNAFAPGLWWHTYLETFDVTFHLDEAQFRWTYYGGGHPPADPEDPPEWDHEKGWEAFNADLANGYTFGSRLTMFDVVDGLDQDGILLPTPSEIDDTNRFWHDYNSEDLGARSLLMSCLRSYSNFGFPTSKDKVAEHLFFGKLQRTPKFASVMHPNFVKKVMYDLNSNMAVDAAYSPVNIELNAPSVMHSLWKSNLAEQANDPEKPRLGFVFCNFSPDSYTVHLEPVDLTELFNYQNAVYITYPYTSSLILLKPVNNPEAFVLGNHFNMNIHAFSARAFGVAAMHNLPSSLGPYTLINHDEYLDLLHLENGSLSVVFGDGSMEYDLNDAVPVLDGVIDVSVGRISSNDKLDIVCVTKTGLSVLTYNENEIFEIVFHDDSVFTDAVKITNIHESELRYIVQDGKFLHQVTFENTTEGKGRTSITAFSDEIDCDPVRTFALENLSADSNMNLVTITDFGAVELLSWQEDVPESMIVIELGTYADEISFSDIDLDGAVDILLEHSSKRGDPDILIHMEGWKYAPKD